MTTVPSVQFHAAISAGRNAISRSGGDGGGRVQFDLPDTEIDALAALMALTGRELIVTVIAVDDLAGIPDDPLPFDEGDGLPFDPGQVGYERTGEELLD